MRAPTKESNPSSGRHRLRVITPNKTALAAGSLPAREDGCVDLNADLGEGSVEEPALLAIITSANVACGFHAGDEASLLETVRGCVAHGVAVGAQVSYDDREGFGRRRVDISYDALRADVLTQLELLAGLCAAAGTTLRYLKPHGALYHRVRVDRQQAEAVIDAMVRFDPRLHLLTMAGGEARSLAERVGVRVVTEGFVDRGYTSDGALIARGQPGALLVEPTLVSTQAVRLAPDVDSLCVHSDTPGAGLLASAARDALVAAGHEVTAWS